MDAREQSSAVILELPPVMLPEQWGVLQGQDKETVVQQLNRFQLPEFRMPNMSRRWVNVQVIKQAALSDPTGADWLELFLRGRG